MEEYEKNICNYASICTLVYWQNKYDIINGDDITIDMFTYSNYKKYDWSNETTPISISYQANISINACNLFSFDDQKYVYVSDLKKSIYDYEKKSNIFLAQFDEQTFRLFNQNDIDIIIKIAPPSIMIRDLNTEKISYCYVESNKINELIHEKKNKRKLY